MAESLLINLLSGSLSTCDLTKWLVNVEETPVSEIHSYDCSKEEFVLYFLDYLRKQTSRFLQAPRTSYNIINAAQKNESLNSNTELLETTNLDRNKSLTVSVNGDACNILTPRKLDENKEIADKSGNSLSCTRGRILSPIHNSNSTNTPSRITPNIINSTPVNKYSKCRNNSAEKCRSFEKGSINLGDFLVTTSNKKKKNSVDQCLNRSLFSETSQGSLGSPILCKNISTSFEANFPALNQSNTSLSTPSKRNRRIKPTKLETNLVTNSTTSVFTTPNKSVEVNRAFNIQQDDNSPNFETERIFLKNQKELIQKQFDNSRINRVVSLTSVSIDKDISIVPADLSKVLNKNELDKIIYLYSNILNNNLVVNIVSEISFIFTLLNTDLCFETDKLQTNSNIDDRINIFTSIHNCTYFAVKTLIFQKEIFCLLDNYTIKALEKNIRILNFCPLLTEYLKTLYEKKNSVKIDLDDSFSRTNNNICFQIETDNIENFTSDQTFRIFRKQRDAFYEILRTWETNHVQQAFSFGTLERKIQYIFHPVSSNSGKQISRNTSSNFYTPVKKTQIPGGFADQYTPTSRFNPMEYNSSCNMAHFARLFVKQLLASCENESTACSQDVLNSLPHIDPNILSKLSSRLVTNESAVDDLKSFTGRQEFFRDFIIYSDDFIFLEHLKITISHELLELNDLHFEEHIEADIDVSVSDSVDCSNVTSSSNQSSELSKFNATSLKVLNSLRILAKFLGFVTDLPFNNNGMKVFNIMNGQNVVREQTQPILDFKTILLVSVKRNNLVITIQWITIYLSMLNQSTLMLKYYRKLIEILFHIYIQCLPLNRRHISYKFPISLERREKYLIRLLLGTLFELPNFPNNFYNWRFSMIQHVCNDTLNNEDTSLMGQNPSSYDTNCENENWTLSINKFSPFYDKILYQSIPSLLSLRGTLGGIKSNINERNKGRVRHVTPLTQSGSNKSLQSEKKNESQKIKSQLEEQFLNGQSPSVRKTIEFVIERVNSATIKYLIGNNLKEARNNVAKSIKSIKSKNKEVIEREILQIYNNHLEVLVKTSQETAKPVIIKRIKTALESLLPTDIPLAVQKMCESLCVDKTESKCRIWIDEHFNDIGLFSKDVESDVDKTLMNNIIEQDSVVLQNYTNGNCSSFVQFDKKTPTPSEVMIMIKDFICDCKEKRDFVEPVKHIEIILNKTETCLKEWNGLLPLMLKGIATITVDFILTIVCHYPDLLKHFLNRFISIWKLDILSDFVVLISSTDTDKVQEEIVGRKLDLEKSDLQHLESIKDESSVQIFSRIMSPRNIISLSLTKTTTAWLALSDVLCSLLKENFLNLDNLADQCLKLLRKEWSTETLENLSKCISQTMKELNRHKAVECSQITLLLEWITDICSEIDF